MNGIQTVQKIRQMQKNRFLHRDLKIVLITGDEREIHSKDTEECKETYGDDGREASSSKLFDDVLLKPVDMNNINIILMRYNI